MLGSKVVNPFHAAGLFLYRLKHQKTRGFLMFSGGIERDHKREMDKFLKIQVAQT